MDERVEAYVDGDLSPAERARFEEGLRLHALWRAHVEQARAVRNELHALPRLTCPPRVVEAVRAEVRQPRTGRTERAPQRHLRLRRPAVWSSALAMMLLLVIVFAVLLRAPEPPPQTQPFTDAEVEQATVEVAWTLAYLARIGEETGRAVEDVLPNSQLVRSTRQALEPVLGKPSDPDAPSR